MENSFYKKIASWGLLRQIKAEEIIDENISSIRLPNQDEFNNLVKQWCRFNKIESEEALNSWKILNGLIDEKWEVFIVRKWQWSFWCVNNFEDKISNYYLERKSYLDMIEYSIIRVKNQNLANELFLRIKEEEETFEDIASKYSEGIEKKTNGHIGPVPLGNAHPLLAHLLQISEEGKLCSPRMIDNWWVIIRKEKLLNTSLNDEIINKLALELGGVFLNNSIDSFIKKNSLRTNIQ
ncbi:MULTISPECIES: peptidylprolyl isomerase [unclassified Prochlorococcus]|uniref:peptidylprolyl isomerase n=1 Tax=unclassified Prochlorococcus TaxID=2627481 RepID=UPI00097CCFFD|nr:MULTISPECIES: peptidylprolyl isomerase [unclassified Prochlorococcus]AQL31341.1 hypothetical protein BSR22_09185 [Prochlorococcus sp. RS50]AQL31717.1 hypothetical protein BS620_01485 [Prochlorococcus sp. RS01]AQL34669.1 hypothetical protein BS621_07805 [Prochlorococcus sp. RS04]